MTFTPINEMGSKITEISKLFDSVLDHYTYDVMNTEAKIRSIMDSILKIGFHDVSLEVHTRNGRINTVITEKSRIFIIEYKLKKKLKKKKKKKEEEKGPSNEAVEQIKEKEYYAQYLRTNLPILLFGITLRVNDKSTNRYIDIHYDIINSNK